jgi:3-hydroxy-9,10-secoandrosta-1,3,5(10)-triene-9,17-dione monooxygenase
MAPDGTVTDSVTVEDLVARAAALGPKLAERRDKTREMRRLPDETVADLIDNGLIQVCQPKRFGGPELPFGAHTDVAMELARHCASTGWVVGILGSHDWWMAKCHPDVQEEIWGTDSKAWVAGAFAFERSKPTKVDGGFRLSGEWVFASGVRQEGWFAVMAHVSEEDGSTTPTMMILPPSDFTIKRIWDPPGLIGTGSDNVIAEDVFVPTHRTVSFLDLNKRKSIGQTLNPGWTYNLPMPRVASYSVAGPVIGMARAALNAFCDNIKARSSYVDRSKLQGFATLQARVAESAAEIDAAQDIYDADMRILRDIAENDRDMTQYEQYRIRRNCGYLSMLCRRATHRLAEALGGGGLKASNLVHQFNLDVLAATGHQALSWDSNATPYGKLMLGLDPDLLPGQRKG